ncbi:MAG: SMP-30/gluconolactonase/LRE family protein [Byssovorax sp.]
MTRKTTLFALIAMGSLLVACSDSGTDGTGGAGSTGGADTTSSQNTSSSSSSSSSSSGGSSAAPELKVVASFDATKGELPEGVTVTPDGKTAYVGFAPSGKIVKVSLPDGSVSALGGLDQPPANNGIMSGLALDAAGNLFAGVTGKAVAGAGVYQIDTTTGKATLVVEGANITFPNGLVFQADGSLLFTDSVLGAVFKADVKAKTVTAWAQDSLLVGVPAPANPCAVGLPASPRGANGIAIVGNQVYVANGQNATVIQIPINADGTAGKPVELAEAKADMLCAPLQGIDGIAADADGSILYMGNTGNTLGRVKPDGTKEVILAKDAKFDFPASISIATVNGERHAIITNFAIATKAKPGLLSYGPLK